MTATAVGTAPSPTDVAGMGAIPHEHGVAFRVWAPNADSVAVEGDFNEWTSSRNPMASEHNGYWSVNVDDAKAGQEYKFVIVNGDKTLHRIDPYARQVTNSVGNGVIYDHDTYDWQGDDFTIDSHNAIVIYEMHIGSFYAPKEDQPGTFELAEAKFRHLKQLGVNVIQVMPVAEFAGDYSWGYNPAHIFAVESGYGGPDAFKDFVKEAHRQGFAVVLDVVYNHFGPSDLDLWQFDGWSENDKGGIYFYNDHRSTTPWGDTRPDYGREEVRRFLHDNALHWMRNYHLDGLRYDMTPYIRSVDASGRDLPDGWDTMRWINETIREEFPNAITIAEDMQQDPSITQVDNHGAAFHAQWDGAFVHPVREALVVSDDEHRSTEALVQAISKKYNHDVFERVIYTESHDEVANGQARIPYEVNEDDPTGWHAQKRSTIGAAITLTSPGIPMLFQGQEFLQGEWFRDDAPLDWDQNAEFRGIVRMYRDLIRLRRNLDGDTRGLQGQNLQIIQSNDADNVLIYHRWQDGGPGDDVVVIVNLSAQERKGYSFGMPHPGHWKLKFNSDAAAYSPDFADGDAFDLDAVPGELDGQQAHAIMDLAPYSVLVYTRG